jgi:hypothetical protein
MTNRIKIYFYGDWAYIAPPWLSVPESLIETNDEEYHDIGIDLKDGRAYVGNNDYYCNVNADEMKALGKMLEFAATISEHSIKGTESISMLRSSFPDADVYVVLGGGND